MIHLAKYFHDVTDQVTEIWCGASGWRFPHPAQAPDDATCSDCLRTAADFGRECEARLREIRGCDQ